MGAKHTTLAALLGLAAVISCGGCTFLTQVVSSLGAPEMTPAKFHGLEGKRVAVVVFDVNSLYGPSGEADLLARAISTQLGLKVKNIQMVKQSEIHDWIDQQDQTQTDFRDVGRGVKADMVVGVDLKGISTRDVGTLLKGRANVAVKVFDMSKGGEVVYETPPTDVEFPETGARHVTESEANFRTMFIQILAERVARDFYAHDRTADYGRDAKFIGD
jgi:hypothetical protein